jgi:hypothetical protein
MFVARGLAINGLAQYSIWKEKSSGKVDQSRRGGLDKREEELPGEEPLSEIRRAIRIEAPDADGFGTAESECESESAGSRRDCCAGRVVRKVSVGMQVGTIVAASTEELPEWLDWW